MQQYMIVPPQGSDQADEWVRLGNESQMAAIGTADPAMRNGKLAEAQQRYQQALRLDPRHALATQNLALVFVQAGMLNEGLLTIERAEMMDGVHAVIKMNRAIMAFAAGCIDVALAEARRAAEMAPRDLPALSALADVLTASGHAAEALAVHNRILDIDPTQSVTATNACFIQTLTDAGPAELLAQRRRWHAAHARRPTPKGAPAGEPREPAAHQNDPAAGRQPLRVGYVSGDFKSHSAAFIFGRVVLHHTPGTVEPYLYSTLPVDPANDARTRRFMDAAGPRWRDISAMSDEAAAAAIRRDRIDILVDLSAHTGGGRLALFMLRPAPVQATAWGFAHGTGCPEIDYFLADPTAVPPAEREHYAEKIVDLPCIVTMEEPTDYKLNASSAPPYRRHGCITFGAYARYEKMSEECLRTFAEILRRVPESRLEFKDNAYRWPYAIRRVMGFMEGIAPERLLFSIGTNHLDHMLAYQQADICLDPWPHGGGVVALEQLYMGVPLVTLYGRQPSGRSGTSILTAMGRGGWCARTKEEYVEVAVRLAGDFKTMSEARKTLRAELLASPVVAGYVEAVEAAYREMWARWCNAQ